jgi:hypothetical protein
LRSICAGDVSKDSGALFLRDLTVDLCSHDEWVDGEQYRCALVAGHKGKCVLGDKLE